MCLVWRGVQLAPDSADYFACSRRAAFRQEAEAREAAGLASDSGDAEGASSDDAGSDEEDAASGELEAASDEEEGAGGELEAASAEAASDSGDDGAAIEGEPGASEADDGAASEAEDDAGHEGGGGESADEAAASGGGESEGEAESGSASGSGSDEGDAGAADAARRERAASGAAAGPRDDAGSVPEGAPGAKRKRAPEPGSLQSLKRRLAGAHARRAAQSAAAPAEAPPADGAAREGGAGEEPSEGAAGEREGGATGADGAAGVPLEYGRILSGEDFARIKELRHKALVTAAMRKHGLKSASKRGRLLAAAEDEADEALAAQACRASGCCPESDPELEGRVFKLLAVLEISMTIAMKRDLASRSSLERSPLKAKHSRRAVAGVAGDSTT